MEDIEEGQPPCGEELTPYASGATLGQHSGRRVRCWGRVSSANGCDVSLRTVDGVEVAVRLRTPSSGAFSWVEVVGTAQGRTIANAEMTPFADSACADVDVDGHKALAHLLMAVDDPWSTGELNNGVAMH